MARTNIVLDEELIEKVQELTGASTKREAVDIALRRLVKMATAYRALRKLRGRLAWEGNLDAWRGGRDAWRGTGEESGQPRGSRVRPRNRMAPVTRSRIR